MGLVVSQGGLSQGLGLGGSGSLVQALRSNEKIINE